MTNTIALERYKGSFKTEVFPSLKEKKNRCRVVIFHQGKMLKGQSIASQFFLFSEPKEVWYKNARSVLD